MTKTDISQLHKQAFDRNILKKVIISNIDSKKWIYNTNYKNALSKLRSRNQEIADQGRKDQEIRHSKQRKETENRILKDFEKKLRQQKNRNNLDSALEPNIYKSIVENLRNDAVCEQNAKQMHFYNKQKQAIPFFMDIPITGEIAFVCDRRIWQMKIFDIFIYYRKENESICLAKIWKWLTTYTQEKLVNWNLTVKVCLKIGDRYYNSNLAIEAVKQYLLYMSKLGFINCENNIYFSENYFIVPKTTVPPNIKAAQDLTIAMDSLTEIYPEIDSMIMNQYNTLSKFNY